MICCHSPLAPKRTPLLMLAAFSAVVVLLHLPAVAAADELPPHLLEMEANLSHEKVLVNEPQEIFATVDLDALTAEVDERPPMNLALVLDRSGSMRGARIQQARNAAVELVDALGKDDRVALVTYGSDVTLEFESKPVTDANRQQMRSTITGVNASGMTNLSGGYEKGVEIVKQHHNDEAVNRVIHLSDGRANRGITDPAQLKSLSRQAFDDGISTTSIGFGLDYNARVMTGMAREGSGNYYFADDDTELDQLIAAEVTGMSGTVVNRIEAIISPGPGVEVAEVYGFNERYRDNNLVIGLSEMSAGLSRNIVLRLNVTARPAEVQEVLDVRVNYRDAVNDRHRYRRHQLQANISESSAQVEEHIRADVMTRVEEVLLARAMDEAMQSYSSGDQSKARSQLDDELEESRQRRARYNYDSDRIQKMDSRMDDMGKTVERAAPSSAAGRQMEMEASEDSFEIMLSK